jgi:hypothetical protein
MASIILILPSDVVHPLFAKIEVSQVDLLKDSFLSKLRSENIYIQLRQDAVFDLNSNFTK